MVRSYLPYSTLIRLATSLLLLPLTLAAQEFSPAWSSLVGNKYDWDNNETILAVAADPNTNLYFAGSVNGSISSSSEMPPVENSILIETGAIDGIVGKADANGNLIWYTIFGDQLTDQMNGVAPLGTQLFAVGTMQRDDDYEGHGSSALIAAMQANDGTELWHLLLDDYGGTNGMHAVTTDSAGRLFVAGYATTPDLDNIVTGNSHQGNHDAVVMCLNPTDGSIIWTHYLGGSNNDRALTLTTGPNNTLYVGGETRSPDWAPYMTTGFTPAANNPCGFIASLDATTGNLNWSSIIGSSSSDAIATLTCSTDKSRLYAGGSTSSSSFLSGKTRLNTHSGSEDGFVLSLNDHGSSLSLNWCRFFGSNTADRVTTLAPHIGDSLVVGGYTTSGNWLPLAGSSTFGGTQDGFLLLLDASGTPLWSRYLGGSNSDSLNALANLDGALYLGGYTRSPTWVGGGWHNTWGKGPSWGLPPDYSHSYGLVALYSAEPATAPAIITQPNNLNLVEGDTALFSLTATGFNPISYRWYRNNSPISGANSNTYTITPVTTAHSGDIFHCLVSNYFGHVNSDYVTLTVAAKGTLNTTLTPPAAVTQGAQWRILPHGTWLNSGTSTNLAPGSYNIEYSEVPGWLTPLVSSNVVVSSSTTTTLNIPYASILPDATRSITSTNITLQVNAPDGIVAWELVETLPPALTPQNITSGGTWNPASHTLTFTGSEATTNTLSYSVATTTSGAYTVTGTITTQPAGHTLPVSGDTAILRANVIRSISVNGTIATITITMFEPQTSIRWTIEETTPATLGTPYNITSPGEWIDDDELIEWTQRSTARTLTYNLDCLPGTHHFHGTAIVVGQTEPIFGDSTLTYGLPDPLPSPNILAFDPLPNGTGYILTFTSVVDQTYLILTNANLANPTGWAPWLPVTGTGPTTTQPIPPHPAPLFLRIQAN